MARWEPNTRARLEQAAMELFAQHGYTRTTVEEIAARAGLTERTFFRYFSDKREVLFSGSADLEAAMTRAVAEAAPEDGPLDAIGRALEAMAALLQERRALPYVRARQALVAAHAELRERELTKLAALGAALATALRARGVAEPGASLAAEAGIAVFKVAFERWVAAPKAGDLGAHVHVALRELHALLTPRSRR